LNLETYRQIPYYGPYSFPLPIATPYRRRPYYQYSGEKSPMLFRVMIQNRDSMSLHPRFRNIDELHYSILSALRSEGFDDVALTAEPWGNRPAVTGKYIGTTVWIYHDHMFELPGREYSEYVIADHVSSSGNARVTLDMVVNMLRWHRELGRGRNWGYPDSNGRTKSIPFP
jgi:hypothetical protein